MKSRIISIFLIIFTLLSVTAFAQDEQIYTDGIFKYTLDENQNATIVYCSDKTSKEIVFPSTINNYPVIRLDGVGSTHLGLSSKNAEKIVISENIEEINYFFSNLENIESLELPSTIRYISPEQFFSHDSTVLNSVKYNSTPLDWCNVEIATYGEYNNRSLTDAVITFRDNDSYPIKKHKQFEYIIQDEFAIITGCDKSAAGKIVIPETIDGYPVTVIGQHAFSYNKGISEIHFPQTIKQISNGAFVYCHALEKINFPDSLETVGSFAFYNTSLSNYTLPDTMLSIGQSAFLTNSSAQKTVINVPYGVSEYSNSAFTLGEVAEITFPRSVTKIEALYTTYVSTKKLVLYIPSTVKEFESHGVYGITDITIYYEGSKEDWNKINFGQHGIGKELKAARKNFNSEIKYTSEEANLGDYSYFEGKNRVIITSINKEISGTFKIPSEINGKPVVSIGHDAFRNSTQMTEIIFPDTIESIGASAFENCGLTKVVLPEKIKVIEARTFFNCRNLTSIQIPASVKEIKVDALGRCDNLKQVYYPDTEKEWNDIVITDFRNSPLITAEINFEKDMPNINAITIIIIVLFVLMFIVGGLIIILIIKSIRKKSDDENEDFDIDDEADDELEENKTDITE